MKITPAPEEKLTAPLDYTKPVYTIEHAIVCPESLMFDERADHEPGIVGGMFGSHNESEAERLGCEVLRGGVQVVIGPRKPPLVAVNNNYFTVENELTNNSDGSKRYVDSSTTPTGFGSAPVATPASEPIPKGSVMTPSDGLGASICPDFKTLAALPNPNAEWLSNNLNESMAVGLSHGAAMNLIKNPIEVSTREQGCTYIYPGIPLVSEGGDPTGSLAVVQHNAWWCDNKRHDIPHRDYPEPTTYCCKSGGA